MESAVGCLVTSKALTQRILFNTRLTGARRIAKLREGRDKDIKAETQGHRGHRGRTNKNIIKTTDCGYVREGGGR
jgi:hypothetical protein